jgi:hypothetical protein
MSSIRDDCSNKKRTQARWAATHKEDAVLSTAGLEDEVNTGVEVSVCGCRTMQKTLAEIDEQTLESNS